MNKIICDKCKAEIQMSIDLIETKFLGEIQINFFRCKNCGVKYLVNVTDKEVRQKQDQLRKVTKELKTLMENVTDETLFKVERLSKELYEKEEELNKEIKSSMAELKKKYEGEL